MATFEASAGGRGWSVFHLFVVPALPPSHEVSADPPWPWRTRRADPVSPA